MGAWTIEICYGILKKELGEKNPDFDQDRMEQQLNNLLKQVKASGKEFTQFKGELLRVNDGCLNKDNLTLSTERVEKSL